MANVKISELPAATVVNAADVIPIDQGNVTRKVRLDQLPSGTGSIAWDNVTDKPASFTPSAHASSHHTSGTDQLAAHQINGQTIFDAVSSFLSTDTTISANRARQLTISNTNASGINVTLPTAADGTLNGDTYVIIGGSTISGPITIRRINMLSPLIYETLATITTTGQQYRFRASGGTTGGWSLVPVDTHTHVAADITDFTAAVEAVSPPADWDTLANKPAAFTPSSHSSSHHTGGADAIAPNQISAAWEQVLSNQTITSDTLLSAGRNRRITLFALGTTANVDLPYENNQAGDVVTLVSNWSMPSTLIIRKAAIMGNDSPLTYSSLATLNASGQSFTFVSNGTATGWSLKSVDTHTHAATQITGLGPAATEDFAAPPAIGSSTPNSGAFTTLTANNGTLTASAPVLDLSQTWNDGSVAFTALRINVTNTASSGASLLIDATASNGTDYFRVARSGQVQINRTAASVAAIAVVTGNISTDNGTVSANFHSQLNSSGVALGSNRLVAWGSTTDANSTPDIIILRDAANTLGQRNADNAQASLIYGRHTSSTNYQRLAIRTKSVTLSALSGASVVTTGGFIPDGAVLVGLTTRVSTAITGATGYDIGDGTD
ncbi:MAG: hypothetical protein VKK63_00205, partial [Synechococcus sp.]|nr:hypothetical protein [Synechococcus sp.]